MLIISEKYKKKLQSLAGIKLLNEVSNEEREKAFELSNQRIPYNKDLMIRAIEEGREIGVLFQSNNSKYKMKVAKYRIIYPVALGLSKKGHEVIRAFHKMGQSEGEALKTGIRSAEVENEWRLMKTSNIKSFWFTGNLFRTAPPLYNAQDKSMINVEVAANFNKIKKFQEDLISNTEKENKVVQNQKNITPLFKGAQEEPKPIPRIIEIPGNENIPSTNKNSTIGTNKTIGTKKSIGTNKKAETNGVETPTVPALKNKK